MTVVPNTSLELRDVQKTYPNASAPALSEFSLSIPRGSRMGILGRSGAGKSTLVRLIGGLETPDKGELLVGGVPLLGRKRTSGSLNIGLVFQHFNLLSQRTALQNVALPLELAGVPVNQRLARARDLLAAVGLADFADRYPAQLSGGQKQRVGIARALANDPELLLADEATSALDPETSASILELLIQLQQERDLTLILVTHQLDVVRAATTHVAILEHGKLVETGETRKVFFSPQHPATKALLEAHQPRIALESSEELQRLELPELGGELLAGLLRDGGRIVQVQPSATGVEVWLVRSRALEVS